MGTHHDAGLVGDALQAAVATRGRAPLAPPESWLLAGIAAAGLWLAGNHYPSGWALVAGAQVLSLPAALTGKPYALHHWRRERWPLVRIRWPGRARRGTVRARW